MRFNYKARTKDGEVQIGVVESSSREAAVSVLQSAGLYVTSLEEEQPSFFSSFSRRFRLFERVSQKELVAFSRQISILFSSEIPLIDILTTLAKQTKNSFFREKILEMTEKVEGGMSLSETFNSFPEIFNSFYVHTVKAGESAGKLSEVFSYLANSLEKDYEFSSKIKGAMIYPIFILVVFVAVLSLMLFWVLPEMTKIVSQQNIELPFVTKMFLNLSDFLKKWGLFLLLTFFFLIIFIFAYLKTKEGKNVFDRFILKIPFLNSLLRKIYLTRFALNLSTLLSGGLPIVRCLEITSKIVGNDVYEKIILETAERVKRGEKISAFLENYPQEMTPLFIQMLVVGEKTGRLNFVLRNIVDFYQKDVERSLDSFLHILEPLLIVILGLVVGVLVGSIIIPIYQMSTNMF